MSKKVLVVVGIAAVVLAGAGIAYKSKSGGPEGVEVETAPVARQTVIQTVAATGRIQPVTQVNISADVSAKITRLDVKEGDWVEKGQFLVELDRQRHLAAVESAEASLSSAEAGATLARENMKKVIRDHERTLELFNKSLESQSALDAAYATAEVERARYRSAQEQVEQAKAALKQARDDLSKTTIMAPMEGTISKLNKEVGEIALGSQFQEVVIMEIANLEGMEALVDVDENDIVSVSLLDGASIEVDALPGLSQSGEVTEIASSAKVSGQGSNDQKTEFEVKIAVTDPSEKLRPGMTASADIVVATHEEALAVPLQCVAVRTVDQLKGEGSSEGEGDSESKWTPDEDGFVQVVFIVENGVAHARQVKTGIQSETHIEILEGIEEGEKVVVGNYRAISRDLAEGTQVIESAGDSDKLAK
ncbi:MAG: efflux RND transporter periplasmic adaptor subunit [Thermoanaerobaculia bacterium]|nr:efflux RND transporter periplasmic adaptor subunit [Thermoanaerobaculia bacterium]